MMAIRHLEVLRLYLKLQSIKKSTTWQSVNIDLWIDDINEAAYCVGDAAAAILATVCRTSTEHFTAKRHQVTNGYDDGTCTAAWRREHLNSCNLFMSSKRACFLLMRQHGIANIHQCFCERRSRRHAPVQAKQRNYYNESERPRQQTRTQWPIQRIQIFVQFKLKFCIRARFFLLTVWLAFHNQ